MKDKHINWIVFILFIVLLLIVRLPAFFQSSIEGDEGLFILIGSRLAEGNLPYTEIWDNKPVGIYVILALALKVLGKSILSIRIIASIAVLATCYLLYKLGNIVGEHDTKVGILAGVLYAVLSTGIDGLSSLTEIYYTPFIVFAFYLLFSIKNNSNQVIQPSNLRLLLIGVSTGIGLIIKQVVIFDFIAILIILTLRLYFQITNNKKLLFTKLVRYYTLLIIGLCLPFILSLIYFTINGHLSEYIYANFYANAKRLSNNQDITIVEFGISILIQTKKLFLLWMSLLLIPLFWLSSKDLSRPAKKNFIYILIWCFMAFVGVGAAQTFYSYHYLQTLPSLCIISSFIIIKTIWTIRGIDTTKRFLLLALILVNPLFNSVYPLIRGGVKSLYFQYVKGVENWEDEPAIIADYLKKRVSKDDYIYVADYLTVMYFLVPAKIPTKYAYPPFFVVPKLSKVAGINPVQELQSIMQKKPVYIIKVKQDLPQKNNNLSSSEKFYLQLDSYLKQDYVLEKEFNTSNNVFEEEETTKIIELYRLKNKGIK